jgi:hypothetical protein
LQNTGGKLATALKPNDNNTIDITNRYVMPIKEEALFCPTQIQHEKFAFFKKNARQLIPNTPWNKATLYQNQVCHGLLGCL